MKKFLVSKNEEKRLLFVKAIKGKKIAIYNGESLLLKEFNLCIDMHKLMEGDYFFEHLAKCDGTTTVVLIDVLIKNEIYVHPYGKIYAFTEQAKQVMVIDTFAFKWNEKQIVRPFLFIDPNILGSSMINFFEGKENTVENYVDKIKPHIEIDVKPIKVKIVKVNPSYGEYSDYTKLKNELINIQKFSKTKVVNRLLDFIDKMDSKKKVIECLKKSKKTLYVTSNKQKNKFKMYDDLRNEDFNKVVFVSTETFGSDNLELEKTKNALERHNLLIKLING